MESNWRNKSRTAFKADFLSLAQHFRPRIKRKPSVWAVEERRIAAGQSPLSSGADIRYSHEIMPHAVEPMDTADDPAINIIVLWMARRLAKTEGICANIIGRTVTDDPGNIYSMWPIEDSADRFSRDVANPMIEASPILCDTFVQKKSRDSGRTLNYLRFGGGSLYIVNAGSASKMRGMAAKVVLAHEIDAYPAETGEEGDPIEKALGRAEGFGDAIKILESTGTLAPTFDDKGQIEYHSNIHRWHDRGDQRKWFCACRRCGRLQWLKFAQIVAPEGKPEKSEYLCERCEAAHNEKQWRAMVRGGKWFPTAGLSMEQLLDIEKFARLAKAPDAAVRSYWINGFNSLLPKGKGYKSKLHQFVAEEARSKSSPQSRRVWINEVDTTLWNPDIEGEAPPDWKPLFDRREDYATPEKIVIPAEALVMTGGIDVHPDRIEVSRWVYGKPDKAHSWALDRVVIPGDTRQSDVWSALEKELLREYDHALGNKIGISFALIDCGHGAEHVMWFLASLRRKGSPLAGKIRACRGSSQYPHPIVDRRYSRLVKQLSGHYVGGDEAKDLIYSELRREKDELGELPVGYRHFGRNLDAEFFSQLCAEKVTVEIRRGEEIRRYKNLDHVRNETLDMAVYSLAAFRLRQWNFEAIEAELKASAEAAKPQTKPRPQVAAAMRERSSFWSL